MRYPFIVVPLLRVIKASGMALFPFILIRDAELQYNPVLVNHEKIHLRQQLEMLILPFYVIYLSHYLFNRIKYADHDRAYRMICFEREAYSAEEDLQYLEKRKLWTWVRYI